MGISTKFKVTGKRVEPQVTLDSIRAMATQTMLGQERVQARCGSSGGKRPVANREQKDDEQRKTTDHESAAITVITEKEEGRGEVGTTDTLAGQHTIVTHNETDFSRNS